MLSSPGFTATAHYHIQQVNGQRIFELRNRAELTPPPRGCEVFVGKLPRDMDEDALVALFARIAPIFELRLMVDFADRNRGYCFVRYFTRVDADRAIRCLNGHVIRDFCRIGVYRSIDNTRLFVGGIPTDKCKHEVKAMLTDHIDEDFEVIMYPSYSNPRQNRGYVFLEFHDHRAAAIARRQMPNGSLVLWGARIKVDWAEPLPEPDPRVMEKVTALYIRNIPPPMLANAFRNFVYSLLDPDTIVRVHKMLDYAFVHFANRQFAEEAKHVLENAAIEGQHLDIMWARPEAYSKKYKTDQVPPHFCLSLPAKSRWLVRRKHFRRFHSDELRTPNGAGSPLIPFSHVYK